MSFTGLLAANIGVTLCVLVSSCSPQPHEPERPETVPLGAIPCPWIAKTTLWVECQKDVEVRCRMWNGAGGMLRDEVFVAYNRQPVDGDELVLDPLGTSDEFVRLRNGRMLLRSSAPTALREFIERVGLEH